MAMTELQAECSQGERINYFLANRLDSQSRQAFVAHVGVCDLCASLLRDLHEDERLARIPLTAEERSRIRAIVHEGREEVSVRLDEDRRQRRPSPAEAPAPRFRPPLLALLAPGPRRVLWLSVAAAAVVAAAVWASCRG